MPDIIATKLSDSDSTNNSQILASFDILPELKEFLENFTNENNITLNNNLLDTEREALASIIAELKRLDIKDATVRQQYIDKLNAWKTTLKHAVYGSSALAALHNSPKNIGIAEHVRTKHTVSLTHWGTDLDIKQCLGRNIIDPKDISAAGTYVLAPNVLFVQAGSTVAEESMKSILQETLKALEANNVAQKVNLLIPVNCGGSHWRLAIIHIENKVIMAADLWDSLHDSIDPGESLETFKKAVDVVAQKDITVTKTATGIQTNSYSCMDYVIRKIYIEKKIENEITQARDPQALRLAIAKEVVTGQPDLGPAVASTLQILDDKAVVIEPEARNKFLSKLGDSKTSQIRFDGFFARELQNLYDKHPVIADAASENKLQQQALDAAYVEFQKTEAEQSSTPRP
jgi:hypothetical protein